MPSSPPQRRPRARVAIIGAALGCIALAGCKDDPHDAIAARCPQPDFTTHSTTIAQDAEGTLWLTSPDDDQLISLNPDTLEVQRSWPTVAGAHQLAIAGGRVVVTGALDTRLAIVDRASGTQTFVDTPCGGTHAVVALDEEGAAFAFSCRNDGETWLLHPDTSSLARATPDDSGQPRGQRPNTLAVNGCRLVIGDLRGQRTDLLITHREALPPTLRLQQIQPGFNRPARAALPHTQLSSLTALLPWGVDFVATASRVDADGPRDLPVEDSTYGSVVDGDPRIAPVIVGACAGEYAVFDGGERVFSGPIAAARLSDSELLVAHAWTHNIAIVRCDEDAALLETTNIAESGDGLRGIAVSPDGDTVWLDVGYDYAVQRLRRSDAGWTSAVVRRAVDNNRYSARAQQGRRLFHDATDQHLTPSGIVACATCHPDGQDDGITWFLHTASVAAKVRRTPSARVVDGLKPLHWDAEFSAAGTLAMTTIQGLMGGDALLIDPQNLAAYMYEIPAPPARPSGDDDDGATQAGELLFNEGHGGFTPCVDCHRGEDSTDGEMHSVLPPSADPDARLVSTVTPSLVGVRARAPYFHDGRSPSLTEAIAEHLDATGLRYGDHLTEQQLHHLALYLQTL